MKLPLFSSILGALGLWAFAITLSAAPPAAKELSRAELSGVLHRYKDLKELDVTFKQEKIFKDISTRLHSEGSLHVKRPDSLVWTILKPSFIEVQIKAGNVQITSGVGEDRIVQNFKPSQSDKDPASRSLHAVASWFSLEPSALSKDYVVKGLDSGVYSFIPRDQSASPFSSLDISLAGDGHIVKATIHERSGDRLEIQFGTPSFNSSLKSSLKGGA
jgi:hypothetical protein